MTKQDAELLEQFVKDHDTRYQPGIREDRGDSILILTRPNDRKELEPVRTLEDYAQHFIEGRDPGPSVRGAWKEWVERRHA